MLDYDKFPNSNLGFSLLLSFVVIFNLGNYFLLSPSLLPKILDVPESPSLESPPNENPPKLLVSDFCFLVAKGLLSFLSSLGRLRVNGLFSSSSFAEVALTLDDKDANGLLELLLSLGLFPKLNGEAAFPLLFRPFGSNGFDLLLFPESLLGLKLNPPVPKVDAGVVWFPNIPPPPF